MIRETKWIENILDSIQDIKSDKSILTPTMALKPEDKFEVISNLHINLREVIEKCQDRAFSFTQWNGIGATLLGILINFKQNGNLDPHLSTTSFYAISILIAMMILFYGLVFLKIRSDYMGTGKVLIKCEKILGFYSNEYFAENSFFGVSYPQDGKYTRPYTITCLMFTNILFFVVLEILLIINYKC